ncbi:hypothetical protein Enr13x_75720 [Stieleria neptunia]|uniref:Uncharacterized protein n=1 Tax=Stieleria neptunia TaxID=2527979 RepID=A0A518I3H7_9BACT|nr:hypothetical protein Enr13x_75720 [Stieleria neptunia]
MVATGEFDKRSIGTAAQARRDSDQVSDLRQPRGRVDCRDVQAIPKGSQPVAGGQRSATSGQRPQSSPRPPDGVAANPGTPPCSASRSMAPPNSDRKIGSDHRRHAVFPPHRTQQEGRKIWGRKTDARKTTPRLSFPTPNFPTSISSRCLLRDSSSEPPLHFALRKLARMSTQSPTRTLASAHGPKPHAGPTPPRLHVNRRIGKQFD